MRLTLEEALAREQDPAPNAHALSLLFSDDAEITTLNARFRGKDRPTNVLSFPDGEDGYLGDVILAYETVYHEAMAQNKSFRDHMLHLVIHGVLHLLGYDHAYPRDAMQMEALEVGILARLCIANPYEKK